MTWLEYLKANLIDPILGTQPEPEPEPLCKLGDMLCEYTEGASKLEDYLPERLAETARNANLFIQKHPQACTYTALGLGGAAVGMFAGWYTSKNQPKKAQSLALRRDVSTREFLDAQIHLKPLIKYYLSKLFPELARKSMLTQREVLAATRDDLVIDHSRYFSMADYECVLTPSGNVCGFILDGGCSVRNAGSLNLKEGFYRAVAGCLKHGYRPEKINLATIINHDDMHFTSSVTELRLNPDFLDTLYAQLPENSENLLPMDELIPAVLQQLGVDAEDDFRLCGVNQIDVSHYDSNAPSEPNSRDIVKYLESCMALLDHNKLTADIQFGAKLCPQQYGNTCGDHAVFNSFMHGVLGMLPIEACMDDYEKHSVALRCLSYRCSPGVRHQSKHDDLVESAKALVKEKVRQAQPKKIVRGTV